MKARVVILAFIITVFLPLNSRQRVAMEERPDYKIQIKEKYKQIDLSDGVSKEEAVIIAQSYLIETGRDKICNLKSAEIFGENDQYWDKNSWHVGFYTTIKEKITTGTKWITISIDKKTGKVTGGGGGPS